MMKIFKIYFLIVLLNLLGLNKCIKSGNTSHQSFIETVAKEPGMKVAQEVCKMSFAEKFNTPLQILQSCGLILQFLGQLSSSNFSLLPSALAATEVRTLPTAVVAYSVVPKEVVSLQNLPSDLLKLPTAIVNSVSLDTDVGHNTLVVNIGNSKSSGSSDSGPNIPNVLSSLARLYKKQKLTELLGQVNQSITGAVNHQGVVSNIVKIENTSLPISAAIKKSQILTLTVGYQTIPIAVPGINRVTGVSAAMIPRNVTTGPKLVLWPTVDRTFIYQPSGWPSKVVMLKNYQFPIVVPVDSSTAQRVP